MSVNYTKLKTNLRLSMERLKLLEKKKAELAQKARKEIADFIQNGKVERAKIRVEHIIREDYLVTAMEIVEMFCDLLLARFGMIEDMKTMDSGLEEAIASLIWVTPRLQSDVKELKVITDIFTHKYGKSFAAACRENSLKNVSNKLMLNMGVTAPPKILVEHYLIEIAKSLNVHYEPDEEVLREHEKFSNKNEGNNSGGGGTSGGGNAEPGLGYPPGPPSELGKPPAIGFIDPVLNPLIDLNPSPFIPPLPSKPPSAPYYPSGPYAGPGGPGSASAPDPKTVEANSPFNPSLYNTSDSVPPSYDTVVANAPNKPITSDVDNLPSPPNLNLPEVPTDDQTSASHNDKFDDLLARFKNLQRK